MPKPSFALIVLLAITGAHGQEPLAIEQAVSLAVKQNPLVKALVRDIAAAERGHAAARSWANPSLTFTPGLTRFGSDEELLISQPLELNGSRAARAGIAKGRLDAVVAESLIELREIVYQTKTAYLQLARAQERLTNLTDLVKNAEDLDRSAQHLVELGSRPGVERIQTSIELSRAKQQATLANSEQVAALAELNALLGRPVESATILVSLKFERIALDEGELLRGALAARSEVALAEANKQTFAQEARLARAEGLPDFAPQFRTGSLTRTPRESGFGLAITIPLIDYGDRRNRIRQAEESAKSQVARMTAARGQVAMEVRQAVSRLKAAQDVLESFQGSILEDARKLLEATRHGFELGATTLVTALEAQRTFRSVQAEYIDALVSHEQARAQLERVTTGFPASALDELRSTGAKHP